MFKSCLEVLHTSPVMHCRIEVYTAGEVPIQYLCMYMRSSPWYQTNNVLRTGTAPPLPSCNMFDPHKYYLCKHWFMCTRHATTDYLTYA